MVDDSYSSPYQRNASPFSSAGASRTRDVFSVSQDESASKRSRWTVMTAQQKNVLASPTPSSASLSMRAPSFCDSSPANSDRGSVASRSQAFLQHANDAASHPASAPEFHYGGIPSSSPTSSHHSEYKPTRYHRSSPGPSSAFQRHGETATISATVESAPVARPAKRGPSTAQRPSAAGPPYGQGDPNAKPAYSYAALIGQALFSTSDLKMALADIYVWIMQLYPYFKKGESGWQNSIRHNLSLNPCFIKTVRGPENPGKGCLWQIKPGTEDQFVDGDFVRKGGQPPTRKSRGKKGKAEKAAEKVEPSNLLRSAAGSSISSGDESPAMTAAATLLAAPPSSQGSHYGRHVSPASVASSIRAPSPAISVASSSRPSMQRELSRAFSPALSAVSTRSTTPALAVSPYSTEQVLLPPLEEMPHPTLTFDIPPPPLISRPATSSGMHRTESEPHLSAAAMTIRSHSSMGFTQEAPQYQHHDHYEQQQQHHHHDEQEEEEMDVVNDIQIDTRTRPTAPSISRTYSLPILPVAGPASPPPSRITSLASSHLHQPLLSATMSPPTSVYHRLAGPYQPLSYGATPRQQIHHQRTPSHSHRALALLASPEAGGIMAGHPGERSTLLSVVSAATSNERGPPSSAAEFLPAPHIFPTLGGGGKRQRTESDERSQSLMSPGALVHTQSPVRPHLPSSLSPVLH